LGDAAQTIKTDSLKRRSSRIVQAVPLTVNGIDALGRPFEERTSTSIINCHGARYQSKHYVLKNMWVTLEVPHPETGHAPRVVRGRVTWIQRPRTVRELFQVGVELEVPGNLWGIAFCPPDWFPFPDSDSDLSLQMPEERAREGQQLAGAEEWPDATEALPAEDNLRTMPATAASAAAAAAAESAAALPQEIARLTAEAKEELHASARDMAAEAVSSEVRPLLASLQDQLRESAQRSVEVASAAAAEQAAQGAAGKAEAVAEERLRALVDRWNEELNRTVEQHYQKLSARSAEIEPQQREAIAQQLQAEAAQGLTQLHAAASDSQAVVERAQGNLEAARRQAEDSVSAALRDAVSRLQAQADDAHTRVSEVENTLRQVVDQIGQVSAATEADWKTRLEADAAAAAQRWNEQVQGSVENVSQRAAERLAGTSQAAGEQFERELGNRVAGFNNSFATTAAELEARLGEARASFESQAGQVQALLAQVQLAAQSVAEQATKLDALHEAAQVEFERRGAAMIENQSQELARRGESALSAWTEQIRPSLEAAGQETITRLGAQIEQRFSSHLDRANDVLGRLQGESLAAEEVRREHEQTLTAVSDRIMESTNAHLQNRVELVQQDLQEAGRNAVAQTLSEIESKANETTHKTFESLFKTAEWYEKKVQAQMQATMEKGLEQGAGQLREKAGEISRLFAGELDHYSRSYVEHTKGQIDEYGRDSLERSRRQSAEMVASAVSTLSHQIKAGTDAAVIDFNTRAAGLQDKLAAQMEEQIAQTRAKVEAVSHRLSAEFGGNASQQAQQAIAHAKNELDSLLESAREALRIESDTRETHLRESLATIGDEGVQTYKQRLESAANSWMLTTVSKLNQESQQHVEELARNAEESLRETCKQVFANVGEALRLQMRDFTVSPPAKHPHNQTE
jgi:hypothetical protein